MKIAVASPPFPKSISDGLHWLQKLTKEAAAGNAELICFPESYLPGYPLLEFEVEMPTPAVLQAALKQAQQIAAESNIAIILPMDWYQGEAYLNVAQVISNKGELLGFQAKNQLDPSEDNTWAAGTERRIFELNGLKFGIVICHEGFRYPETVRWAARHGAQIVFHPHCAGSNAKGKLPVAWGSMDNPYYEKAMMIRALENTVYFASSNYCFDYPESASSLIAPDGECLACQPYAKPGIFVAEIDPAKATGFLAKRFKPALYAE